MGALHPHVPLSSIYPPHIPDSSPRQSPPGAPAWSILSTSLTLPLPPAALVDKIQARKGWGEPNRYPLLQVQQTPDKHSENDTFQTNLAVQLTLECASCGLHVHIQDIHYGYVYSGMQRSIKKGLQWKTDTSQFCMVILHITIATPWSLIQKAVNSYFSVTSVSTILALWFSHCWGKNTRIFFRGEWDCSASLNLLCS